MIHADRGDDTYFWYQYIRGIKPASEACLKYDCITALFLKILTGQEEKKFKICRMNELIRWIDNEDVDPKKLNLTSDTKRIQDLKGKHLLLFSSEWNITWATEHNKDLILTDFSKN